ncbi:MAG: alpha 1,2-mannosyltransferase 2.4.1 [Cyphobasidiales sp. Tagirdzhanova-0007]|nr:MAG: alpha 1,2-mannosyltransferase 2.4.1 [Cyphobasidiales sp. Tagirdzhanova-0007]
MPAIPLRARLAGIVVVGVLLVHLSLVKLSPDSTYAKKTSFASLRGSAGGDDKKEVQEMYEAPDGPSAAQSGTNTTRAKAAFVVLARNSDLWSIMESIRFMEDRFNRKYNYPYVFLNDQPFDETFKKMTSGIISGKVEYGLIPQNQWSKHPSWIDEDKAKDAREAMAKNNVIYGDSVPYREMCRYQSGFFFRHPLLDPYEWYWRIEPNVKYFCDLDYDPFLYMQERGLKYGFTISIYEYIETIPTLWDTVKDFIREFPDLVPERNAMTFLSEDGGETYNRCHFWSNFEIGSLSLWRSEAYLKFFEYLDRAGGFYYERWGDAPVHSIAAALFLPFEDIHYFYDIAYRHEPFAHCPKGEVHENRCYCDPGETFNDHWYSCTPRFLAEKSIAAKTSTQSTKKSVFDVSAQR